MSGVRVPAPPLTMKIFIYIFIYSFIIISCTTNSYHDISYYDNGQKQYNIEYKNNKIDGLALYWDEKGNIINKVHYVNNKFHGKWIDYYINGNIKHIVDYEYGKKDGEEIWYYESGNIKSKVIYKDDQIISNILRWNDNGRIIEQ